MRNRDGYRDTLVPQMQRFEAQVLAELAVEQVTHVPLEEYAEGSPRLERLREQMALAQKYRFPSSLVLNV